MMTAVVPNRPSSSPMAAKMKSVSTTGMRSGLPRPRPVPGDAAPRQREPALDDLEARRRWPSGHGLSQIVDAVLRRGRTSVQAK